MWAELPHASDHHAVFDLSGGRLTPPLVDDDPPPLMTAKFGLGGQIGPPQKGPKSKFVVKSL